MQNILETVAVIAIFMTVTYIFFVLMKSALPAWFMKRRLSSGVNLGRGLKKFISDNGRAVLYEPQPSHRKYVRQYLLYTKDKHKYFRCETDGEIFDISYGIVMFNARGRIIDVLNVKEHKDRGEALRAVLLHHETSYVALLLYSVNGETVSDGSANFYHRFTDVLAYGISVSLLSFLFTLFVAWSVDLFGKIALESEIGLLLNPLYYVLPAILIGALSAVITLSFSKNKGAKVVFYDKQR